MTATAATLVDIARRPGDVAVRCTPGLIVPRLVGRTADSARVALVASQAMLLPGDAVELDINLGAGTHLELVDVGGLVVYGGPDRGDAAAEPGSWRARVTLGEGASLTWGGLPTVVADHGHLRRELIVELAEGARALLRETLVLGRSGELGGTLTASMCVTDPDGPILVESLDVDGHDPRPGILGRHRIVDSILALGPGPGLPEVAGATRLALERGGDVLRFLGDQAHLSGLGDAWQSAAATLITRPDRPGARSA